MADLLEHKISYTHPRLHIVAQVRMTVATYRVEGSWRPGEPADRADWVIRRNKAGGPQLKYAEYCKAIIETCLAAGEAWFATTECQDSLREAKRKELTQAAQLTEACVRQAVEWLQEKQQKRDAARRALEAFEERHPNDLQG